MDCTDKYSFLFLSADGFRELQCLLNFEPIKICEVFLVLTELKAPHQLSDIERELIANSFDVAMETVCHMNDRFLEIFIVAWFNKMLGGWLPAIDLIKHMNQFKNLFFVSLLDELTFSDNVRSHKMYEIHNINKIVREPSIE